jgi:hypothetical protein
LRLSHGAARRCVQIHLLTQALAAPVHEAHVTASIEKYGEGYSADDYSQPLTFEVRLTPAGEQMIVGAEVSVRRTAFGMTWSPLRMPSSTALLMAHVQFDKKG